MSLPPPQHSDFSYAPCPSSNSTSNCVAWAVDAYGNDVTASITVVDVTPCAANASFCSHCNPAQMTLGACLDGKYTFRYTAKSLSGDKSSSLLINFVVESYAYSTFTATGVFVRNEREAKQMAVNLKYSAAAVNKMVYDALKVWQ